MYKTTTWQKSLLENAQSQIEVAISSLPDVISVFCITFKWTSSCSTTLRSLWEITRQANWPQRTLKKIERNLKSRKKNKKKQNWNLTLESPSNQWLHNLLASSSSETTLTSWTTSSLILWPTRSQTSKRCWDNKQKTLTQRPSNRALLKWTRWRRFGRTRSWILWPSSSRLMTLLSKRTTQESTATRSFSTRNRIQCKNLGLSRPPIPESTKTLAT